MRRRHRQHGPQQPRVRAIARSREPLRSALSPSLLLGLLLLSLLLGGWLAG